MKTILKFVKKFFLLNPSFLNELLKSDWRDTFNTYDFYLI